jgi:hypothetical protein
MKNFENSPTYKHLENLSKLIDDKFELFGFRFGIGFLIDLVPGIGDIAVLLISLYLFSVSIKYKIQKRTMLRMLFNIFIYFIVGLIPLLGDLAAAWWKPNMRNLKLVQKRLNTP